jgi:hypothetical protein
MLARFEESGLSGRMTAFEPSAGELLVTWLTPLLREYETVEQLRGAGAESIQGEEPDATRRRLKSHQDALGGRVCALWPFDAFAVEIGLHAFADHLDDLWYPGAEDVWLLWPRRARVLVINHEELVLHLDLDGPTRWPVWKPRRVS